MNAEDWVVPIFNEIRAVAPSAHIAGGYLRDQDNDRPVKDVDVWVGNQDDFDQAANVIMKTHPLLLGSSEAHYEAGEGRIAYAWVYENPHHDYPQINLILLNDGVNTLDSNIQNFDFGICQIAWDGSVTTKTGAYETDKQNRTFTLLRAENQTQFDRSMERYRRLSAKYPGWELVVPERFKHFQFEEIPF